MLSFSITVEMHWKKWWKFFEWVKSWLRMFRFSTTPKVKKFGQDMSQDMSRNSQLMHPKEKKLLNRLNFISLLTCMKLILEISKKNVEMILDNELDGNWWVRWIKKEHFLLQQKSSWWKNHETFLKIEFLFSQLQIKTWKNSDESPFRSVLRKRFSINFGLWKMLFFSRQESWSKIIKRF